MKAIVDRDACTGCSLCEAIAPDVFEMDDDFIATVKVDPVPVDSEDDAREAADSCPDEAISIEE